MENINFNKPFKTAQLENTIKARQELLDAGMIELTPAEINEHLAAMGFKIDKSCTFNYYNTANEISYNACSVSIIDIKSKMSFAHFQFGVNGESAERKAELQKFRFKHFGFDGKTILDL